MKLLYFILILLLAYLDSSAQFAFLYSTTGMEYGKANAVDIDNSYINSGLFQNTINVNPAGTTTLSAPGLSTQIVLTKYSKTGQLIWGKMMGGTATSEAPHGVECDASKNIYMTGYFGSTTLTGPQNADFNPAGGGTISTQGNEDCFVSKYDLNGNYLWAFGLGNIGAETQERSWDIAVEPTGNLYVGGGYHGSMNFNPLGTAITKNLPDANAGLFLAKYNSNGICQWVLSLNAGCINVFTEAYITFDLDNNGNLYVAGNFRGSNVDFNPNGTALLMSSSGLTDMFIAKYNCADGTLIWVKKIGGTLAEIVSPGALRCDNNENPYFTGRLSGTGNVDFDPTTNTVNVSNSALFLTSFDPSGNLRFAYGFNSGTGDGGHRISFDSQNNAYLAGWINGIVNFGNGINITANAPTADAFLAKFTNAGICQWAFSFGGSDATENNICAGLIIDQEDNAYMTGQLYGTNADFDPSPTNQLLLSSVGQNDCFLAKYNSNGNLWTNSSTDIKDFQNINQTSLVYPNPAKDIITIRTTIDYSKIRILNSLGQEIYSSSRTESVYISSLTNGLYFLQLLDKNTNPILTKKFIKQD